MANSSREPSILPLQETQSCSDGSQQTRARPSTPYQLQPPMSQRPSQRSIYSRIQDAKDATERSEFYTDEDVRRYAPEGLPAAVAAQVHYPNVNLLRRFGHLNNHVLVYLLQQLSCIEDAFDGLYAEARRPQGGGGGPLTSLPFDREQFISRCLRSPDHLSVPGGPQKKKQQEEEEEEGGKGEDTPVPVPVQMQMQNLVANAVRISKDYHEAFLWEHESHKFSPVSHRAHLASFEMLRDTHGLGGEALGPWRAIDDLITPESDTVYERFEYLLYRGKSWVATGLQYCCRGRRPAGASAAGAQGGEEEGRRGGDTRMEVSERLFRWSVKLFMGLGGSAPVLVPFGLLYLGMVSRAAAFWIVAGFGLVFGFVMVVLEFCMVRVMIGVLAYYAVLASILSNLS